MLVATVRGFRYQRVLVAAVDPALGDRLREGFDYSFVVSYGGFDAPGWEVVDKHSALIDLSRGLEAAFSEFNATTRNEIRKTERESGLEVRFDVEPFDEIYAFHASCERERGWLPVPESELSASLVCICYWNGEPLAGISCYENDEMLRVGRIFSRRRSVEWEQAHAAPKWLFGAAQRRVVHELCRHVVARGQRRLDLGGIDLGDDAKSGISRFKLSFGSTVVPVKIGRYQTDAFRAAQADIRAAGYDLT
jgi:hypothetical protein